MKKETIITNGYVEISTTKNKQFKVVNKGANGEPLSVSETFKSKQKGINNIIAHMTLYAFNFTYTSDISVIVHDKILKIWYYLHYDRSKENIVDEPL